MPKPSPRTSSSEARDAAPERSGAQEALDATFYRAENEDDDGYDPYSDRPASPEPLFERDPWA